MESEHLVKIAFELEQDEDGYPPDKWESLWAQELHEKGRYCIDNIPFYVKGISSEDVVGAEEQAGRLVFTRLLQSSLNSVFRIYVGSPDDAQPARESFRLLGCESEQSDNPKLFAIEVPRHVSIAPVLARIVEGNESGLWDYEEGVLRHKLP